MWACINYHVSVTHYKHPYDVQMAQNRSAIGSVLAPGASHSDNTVVLFPNYFTPSSEQPEQRILAYKSKQPLPVV